MELLTVTKDIAIRSILFGDCKIPKIGATVNSFSFEDLSWAERMFSPEELRAFFKVPLWTLSVYVYGDGYGDGYGSGKDIGAMVIALNEKEK